MKRKVLSFDQFITEALKYPSIMEAEGSDFAQIDFVKELLGGTFLDTNDRAILTKIIDDPSGLDAMDFTKAQADQLKEALNSLRDRSKGEWKNVKGMLGKGKDLTPFEYLVNGTVAAKNLDFISGDSIDALNAEATYTTDFTSDTERVGIKALLRLIFLYNIYLADEYTVNKDLVKQVANAGKKSKKTQDYQFICIDEEQLKSNTIVLKPFVPNTSPINGGDNPQTNVFATASEYATIFPIYSIDRIIPKGGEDMSSEIFTEVIKPLPGEKIEKITDKPYNSSGTDFFGENEVKISEDGMAALKSMISKFHSIDKIVVNGGASSKPTSRAGGNEKLAEDRMNAGVTALNDLKTKDKVEQLKDAVIEPGEAKVQDAAPNESDPKNQQVSFIISGSIRKIDYDPKPDIIIKKTVNEKFDKLILQKSYFSVRFDLA